MEHTRITAPAASPLAPEMLATFAEAGLRELLHVPIPKVARAFAHFDREQLGTAIEVMIAMLDAADGDPDAETGNDVEDDFALSDRALISDTGPGCGISDTDAGAYVEWHTKPSNLKRNGQSEILAGHEDAEEDDPPGQCDEDGINTLQSLAVSGQPGCAISDTDYCTAGEDRITGCVGPQETGIGDATDCEITYPEWNSLPASQRSAGTFMGKALDDDWAGLGLVDDAEDADQDTCLAADDQGMAGGRWFDRDGLPGDPEDAEDGHDREDTGVEV